MLTSCLHHDTGHTLTLLSTVFDATPIVTIPPNVLVQWLCRYAQTGTQLAVFRVLLTALRARVGPIVTWQPRFVTCICARTDVPSGLPFVEACVERYPGMMTRDVWGQLFVASSSAEHFHRHTSWHLTDEEIDTMLRAGRALAREYLIPRDHSRHLTACILGGNVHMLSTFNYTRFSRAHFLAAITSGSIEMLIFVFNASSVTHLDTVMIQAVLAHNVSEFLLYFQVVYPESCTLHADTLRQACEQEKLPAVDLILHYGPPFPLALLHGMVTSIQLYSDMQASSAARAIVERLRRYGQKIK